ncbi:Pro-Pol polyprotein [Trachymyrmex cornetzi]|uniref:Pro-Pol polyprotein n=1 Tax=Trachymyrmex cornetzi TaxID=471704 RepID=A0A151J7S5_9HYME|nr:Pro-Pol polyprotein [Trachymyrmex cornetzi]
MKPLEGNDFTVHELKDALRERGLFTTGTKTELVLRLSVVDPNIWTILGEKRRQALTGNASSTDTAVETTDESTSPVDNTLVPEGGSRSLPLLPEEPDDHSQRELELIQKERELKHRLASKPMLAIYSPNADSELHCDASASGFGGILFQKQGDCSWKPISFWSQRTTPTEAKYHSYELECLAVIYALKRFHIYLMREKVKEHIANCLRCIEFSPSSGKSEGFLHNIPKEKLPFATIHVDHFGPLEKTGKGNRHILLIVDAFTKFIRVYTCKATTTDESRKCLRDYFRAYSKPKRLVSDRGSCFTSDLFKEFSKDEIFSISLSP